MYFDNNIIMVNADRQLTVLGKLIVVKKKNNEFRSKLKRPRRSTVKVIYGGFCFVSDSSRVLKCSWKNS